MVINSKCNKPFQNWDGKILNFRVWWGNSKPPHFNLHYEKYLPDEFKDNVQNRTFTNERTVVLWGTHHKTGTFLAKKIFAKMCAHLNWCCLFHVTRDSVHAVKDALYNEPVNALGHNQWIWHPTELNITNYRFIHFYRTPFRKIISGFRYHADGTEQWTQKPQKYNEICHRANELQAADKRVSKKDVINYCESVHLCETCCRREHEQLPEGRLIAMHESEKHFEKRSPAEYRFLCEQLGGVNKSIQHTLTRVSEELAVVVEAALDYYEILRMAQLYNQTSQDPYTLNLDLDYFTENFEEGTWKILHHLKDLIPATELTALHNDLNFYNLETSPLYRWSMNNPIINHVTSQQEGRRSTRELVQILKSNSQVMQLYQPSLDLMGL
jgi:hypothetical protein